MSALDRIVAILAAPATPRNADVDLIASTAGVDADEIRGLIAAGLIPLTLGQTPRDAAMLAKAYALASDLNIDAEWFCDMLPASRLSETSYRQLVVRIADAYATGMGAGAIRIDPDLHDAMIAIASAATSIDNADGRRFGRRRNARKTAGVSVRIARSTDRPALRLLSA